MTPMEEAEAPHRFTPHEAAETLTRLEHYEEGLTTRAGALTWMFFGLGGAAIFLTYETASPLFIDAGMPWLLSFLWIPWIAGAGILTNGLWKMLSIAAPVKHSTKETWWSTIGGSLLFFALALVVWGAARAGGGRVDLGDSAGWAMVLGAFTAVLALWQSHHYKARAIRVPFVLAGLAIFATGAALAIWPPADPADGLVATGVDLLAYFTAGMYVYRRG